MFQKGVILRFTGWCFTGGDLTIQIWRPKIKYNILTFRLVSEVKLSVTNYPNTCQV